MKENDNLLVFKFEFDNGANSKKRMSEMYQAFKYYFKEQFEDVSNKNIKVIIIPSNKFDFSCVYPIPVAISLKEIEEINKEIKKKLTNLDKKTQGTDINKYVKKDLRFYKLEKVLKENKLL